MANIVDLLFRADSSQVKDAKSAVDDLGKSIPGCNEAIEAMTKAWESFEHALAAGAGVIGGATVAVGGLVVALGALGVAMAFEFAEKIDKLGDLGDKFGYTADQIYYLKQSAEDAGTSLDAIIKASDKIEKAMNESGKSTSAAGQAFHHFGVAALDAKGKLRDSNDVLQEVVEAYDKSGKTVADNVAMQALLGKTWREQAEAARVAKEAMQEYNEMHEKGIGFEKASRQLGAVMNDVGSRLIEIVIPAFTQLKEWMVKSYEQGGFVKGVFVVIEAATWGLMTAIKALASTFSLLSAAWDVGKERISDDWDDIVTRTIAGKNALTAALHGHFEEAGKIWDAGSKQVEQNEKKQADAVSKIWQNALAGINQQWKGHWDSLHLLGKAGELQDPNKSSNAGGTPTKEDKEGKDPNAAANALLLTMQKQLMVASQMTQVQIAAKILKEDKYKYADNALKMSILEVANEIDLAKAMEISRKTSEEIVKVQQQYSNTINDQIKHQTMSANQIAKEKALREVQLQIEKEIVELKAKGLNDDEAIIAAQATAAKANKDIEDSYKKQEANRADYFAGIKVGIQGVKDDYGDFNKMASDVTKGAFDKMSSSLTDFVTTGKANFKDMAASILKDIANMIIKMEIFNALKAAGVGFANGGAFDKGTQMFADGGVVSSPTNFGMANGQMGLMGEAGPEAIMPLSRDATGKLGVKSSGGGGGTNIGAVTVQVIVQSNGQQTGTQQGQQISKAVVDAMKQIARGEIMQQQRPGNLLSNGMS